MIKVNCRICRNCDLENGRCKFYGSDPKKAASRCAASGFANYKPVNPKLSVYRGEDNNAKIH